MIPVLGVPVLNKVDLFDRMMGTVDHPVDKLYIVNNGHLTFRDSYTNVSRVHVVNADYNMGVAASWNLIIKANMNAPYWVIGCNDMKVEHGILAQIEQRMEEVGDSEPHLLRVRIGNEDWGNHYGLFAMNPKFIDELGFFDENFIPVFFEDTDMLVRIARHGGVRMTLIGSSSFHDGNMSWKDNPVLAAENKKSWDMNVKYFDAKWGVQDGVKTFDSPFGKGGALSDWSQPSISKMRRAHWKGFSSEW